MATYAIGDVQGCHDALRRLLDQLRFDPAQDRLWFAGDLINRGPQSVKALRYVRSLGDAAVTVLGNHDLHVLAVANGRKPGRRDTVDEILQAPDRDELLDWLRHRPLVHQSGDQQWLMLHAGLPPQWSVQDAVQHAREAEAALVAAEHGELLQRMYGDQPDRWDPALTGIARIRFVINCFTRLRYCSAEGRIDPDSKGAPGSEPPGLMPWFAVPERRSAGQKILFGHWSTLGRIHWPEHAVWGLDTGCVWGGALTALCLETGTLHSHDCTQYRQPGAD